LHKLAQYEASLSPGRLLLWIDANAFHAREIDDHAAIADGTATDAVPTAAHRHEQVVIASDLDGMDHIDHVGTEQDSALAQSDLPLLDGAPCFVAVREWASATRE
jgi:hypothetical protein